MDSQRCVRTGLHYASEERIQVTWSPDGRIDSLLPGEGEETIWIAPGLIDLQINGGYGYDLNSLPLTFMYFLKESIRNISYQPGFQILNDCLN
ncbi:hypothetical protein ACQKI4_13960 [Paenibacillus glucanolyticus]|uniref:hypothetical protein n=1 Tax=Paenibacillus glucanolyticus TaxID=59843 RepID=UPI003D040F65